MIHTPYDGSHKPFTIGLSQLDPAEWIEVDHNYALYLDEKRRLYDVETRNVLVAEAETLAAQTEVLAMLVEYLPQRFPEHYALQNRVMHIMAGRYSVDLDAQQMSPIAIAGLLVQEDLVLMRKSPEGWRLVAASLCFPSAWNLREKFGHPLHAIHQSVPGFGEGTRNAGLIDRMFDNLWPERPVLRWNWTLFSESKLYYPVAENGMGRRFSNAKGSNTVTLRLERQTLRKLPNSGDILFTIRTHLNPLEVLETIAQGAGLAKAIADQVANLNEAEISYKGLTNERDWLFTRLQKIIAR